MEELRARNLKSTLEIFFYVSHEDTKYTKPFVSGTPFVTNLIFASQARVYLSKCIHQIPLGIDSFI